ncbi:hypothetical protein [Hydrogenimonas thermophila]|uniref:Uncharacterized protein n=1 Tax=Hydrogenimonas thermophila TaxID=223786 RepID=A0A1I5UNC4_9BACT|nr:hypothetical protein [Hydrogenimonas thermophila]SFP96096.1 hypothetical protein SAMN05216234_1652 [Hydrogenimonas thermophila]
MAKMGKKSRSFMRYSENYELIGDLEHFKGESKRVISEFMFRFEKDDRAVFYAENLNVKTQDELNEIKKELSEELRLAGFDGVLELHPTSDATSKSGHIHLWGGIDENIEKIVENYIKAHNLSNKEFLNYTNEDMNENTKHIFIKKLDKVIQKDFETNKKIEFKFEDFERESALKNSKKFDKKNDEFYELLKDVELTLAEFDAYIAELDERELEKLEELKSAGEDVKIVTEAEDLSDFSLSIAEKMLEEFGEYLQC